MEYRRSRVGATLGTVLVVLAASSARADDCGVTFSLASPMEASTVAWSVDGPRLSECTTPIEGAVLVHDSDCAVARDGSAAECAPMPFVVLLQDNFRGPVDLAQCRVSAAKDIVANMSARGSYVTTSDLARGAQPPAIDITAVECPYTAGGNAREASSKYGRVLGPRDPLHRRVEFTIDAPTTVNAVAASVFYDALPGALIGTGAAVRCAANPDAGIIASFNHCDGQKGPGCVVGVRELRVALISPGGIPGGQSLFSCDVDTDGRNLTPSDFHIDMREVASETTRQATGSPDVHDARLVAQEAAK